MGKPPAGDYITIQLGDVFCEDQTDGMPQDRVTFSVLVTVLLDLKFRLRHGQFVDFSHLVESLTSMDSWSMFVCHGGECNGDGGGGEWGCDVRCHEDWRLGASPR